MSSKRGGQARVADDDSDLEDLLQHKGGETVESAPLNLDHLTKGQFDVPRRSGPGLTALASAHCRYLCYMYPRCCGTISVMAVAFAMFMFIGSLVNPTETFGVITNDWTTITSQYDLKVGNIDHWCLKGDNDSCRCEDPLVPASRMEFKTWNDAFNENKKKVEAFRESNLLDVAFLGESLVEEMDGRWMGRQEGEELKSIREVFQAQFKRDISGIEGVALGIAGDTSPNVLWRLLHGEMPTDFDPRVWWLVLGMNDLGRMQCSEEVVVLGILRVVEEIRRQKPSAQIVINSMLPMADLRGGVIPQMIDYRDAFKPMRGPDGIMKPDLQFRPGAPGTMGSVPKVTYTRPSTTTEAIKNRKNSPYRADVRVSPGSTTVAGGNHRLLKEKDDTNKKQLTKEEKKKAKEERKKDREDEKKEREAEKQDEKKKKKEEKEEEKFMKKIKKDPVNPKLNLDVTKIKARDPKTLFLSRNRLPIWTSIHSINEQLKKFAGNATKVTFFDATNIFAEKVEENKYVLQSDKISIRGHPTLLGFQDWEEAMAKRLTEILKQSDEELREELAKQGQPGKTPENSTSNDDTIFDGSDDDS